MITKTKIRIYRDSLGISQSEMAHRLGLDAGTLSEYETGRRIPSLATAFRLQDLTEGVVDARSWVEAPEAPRSYCPPEEEYPKKVKYY